MRHQFPVWLIALCFLPTSKTLAQHFFYTPNSAQTPAFQQRHDAGIGIGFSRGAASKAFEIQGYYSPINKVAIIANYMDLGSGDVLKNTQEGVKYRFYELGAGVYEALPHGSASLIAGIGHGDVYNYFQGEEAADLNMLRWFVQPSVTYKDSYFQGGFCLRLSSVHFSSGRVAIAIPASDLSAIETIEEKSPFWLPEIGVNGGMRLGPFLLGISATGIFPRTDGLNFVRINSSVFLTVELGKLTRGKQKTPVNS